MRIGVVITTYNSPNWLTRVLWGYEQQSHSDFETIIADDGSGTPTRDVIRHFQQRGRLNLRHVWHEDIGFRKTMILNKAIQETPCDYLIFTDGDCVPRHDLVETHARYAEPGHLLSAGYFKLTMDVSWKVDEDAISSGKAFQFRWLRAQGQPWSLRSLRCTQSSRLARFLDTVTTTRPTWNGANSSGWKSDLLAVNGFDERLRYGGLDRELGERLTNFGIRGKQIRYSAVCLHLDHKRSYDTPETWVFNNSIREAVRRDRIKWTPFGILQSSSEERKVA
ncbi:MAG TPA: glycosyltransferase family 2 protein [Planctomicrobium sp.]|nr:glycosyltransferase family 2 protein [Planctomicrobium sp.]